MCQAILRPDLFEENRALVVGSPALVVEGRLRKKDGTLSVRAERFEQMSLEEPIPRTAKARFAAVSPQPGEHAAEPRFPVKHDAPPALCGSGRDQAFSYHFYVTEAARHLLEAFRTLPDLDKREVLAALLREATGAPYAAPSDDDLTAAADEVFLDFDRRETGG